MCGGLVMAAGFNSQRPILVLIYNLGRITTYSILGLILGFASSWLPSSALPILTWLSASLLVLTALYLIGLGQWITRIEAIGVPIWKNIQPYTRHLLPVRSAKAALTLGLLWGFLPCGLIYTALAFSASQGSPFQSSMSMLAFGLGTLPIMMATGWLAGILRPLLQNRRVKAVFAMLLIVTAGFIVFTPTMSH